MSISKPETYAQEIAIFQLRGEVGLQNLRKWLWERRESSRWTEMVGEELIREQGEVRLASKLLKMIDVGPTIKAKGSA
jgi:hypothetical protein